MPCLGAEPRSEAIEAPPTPLAKNTWAMATGSSARQWRCVVVVVEDVVVVVVVVKTFFVVKKKITYSAHTKFP